MTEVRVPDIGDFTDVPIIEVHVEPGSAVAVEDPLITLESDKATMDVPSPEAGTVSQLAVKVGDRVSQGKVSIMNARMKDTKRHKDATDQIEGVLKRNHGVKDF